MRLLVVSILLVFSTQICLSQLHEANSYNEIEAKKWKFDFKRESPTIVSSIGLFSAALIARHYNEDKIISLEKINQLDPEDINDFDRIAIGNFDKTAGRISDYIQLGVSLSPLLFLSSEKSKSEFYRVLLISSEVVMTNFGLTHLSKNLIHRPRPFIFLESLGDSRERSRNNQSFYSGHTSHVSAMSFLAGNLVNHYFPDMDKKYKSIIWVTVSTIPAITAYLRVKAGKHYPSDVIVGYGAGALVGWLIPKINFRDDSTNLAAYPTANGLSLLYKF